MYDPCPNFQNTPTVIDVVCKCGDFFIDKSKSKKKIKGKVSAKLS
jgi:hypothetical protein